MASAVKIAREKISALKSQISELERFIAVHDTLLSGATEQQMLSKIEAVANTVRFEKVPGNNPTDELPVDNFEGRSRRNKDGMRPDHMAELMERIIREVGHPMTRGELVSAMEARDVRLPYEDKGRYLGTIAWRNKGIFINLEGRGYWLRDMPVPDAKPQSEQPQTDLLN